MRSVVLDLSPKEDKHRHKPKKQEYGGYGPTSTGPGGGGGGLPNNQPGVFALGINLSGMEDPTAFVSSQDYFDYYTNIGVKKFRVQLTWAKMQAVPGGPLVWGQANDNNVNIGYDQAIRIMNARAAAAGAQIMWDIHNFGQDMAGRKIGTPGAATPAQFADFIAKFGTFLMADPNFSAVYAIDVMNEWNSMDPNSTAPSTLYSQGLILNCNQLAVQALRAVGWTKTIYLEWDHFSGAWDSVANNISTLMDVVLADTDSIIQVHCYLDNDSSGTNYVWAQEIAKPGLAPPGYPTSPTIGITRMSPVTTLAAQKGVRLCLGETGWSADKLTDGGNDDYADWNNCAQNLIQFCKDNKIEVFPFGAGPGFPASYGYNYEPSNTSNPANKDFTVAGLQSTQIVTMEKFTGSNVSQPLAYRVDVPFNTVPYAPSGTAINNFKIRYNGKITAPITWTGFARLADGTNVGGTFTPTVSPSPSDNTIQTFSYTPSGSHAGIRLSFTNNAGLIDAPFVGCSSQADRFITDGTTPAGVYDLRLRYNSYVGPAITLQRFDGAKQSFYFNVAGNLPRQAIQDWAQSRLINLVTLFDQTPNGNNCGYIGGSFAQLNLVNSAGYPEIIFPTGAQYGFNTPFGFSTATNSNTQQTIISRISDQGGSTFLDMSNANVGSYFPFRYSPSAYTVTNSPLNTTASVSLGSETGVYHTYAGTFKAGQSSGLIGYKDGTQTATASTTNIPGLPSTGVFTTLGYFFFFPGTNWHGSFTGFMLFQLALTPTQISHFASDDTSYYTTPLPDPLTAAPPTITGFSDSSLFGTTSSPFSSVVVTDTNSGSPTDSVIITLSGSSATLSGTGLSGSNPYTLASDTPANITTKLQALTLTTAASIGSTISVSLEVNTSSSTSATQIRTVTVSGYGMETPLTPPAGTFTPLTTAAKYKGVNVSGAENFNFTIFPRPFQIDYYAAKGMGTIRMPIQPGNAVNPASTGGSPLDTTFLAGMKSVLDYCFTKGMYVIIDVHSYGQINGATNTALNIGSSSTANNNFADLWSRISSRFKNYPNAIFGLMNEPSQGGVSASQWGDAAKIAIGAIRATGATQKILIPGIDFSHADFWTASGNAAYWAGYTGDTNFAFDMHEYLDSDGSGTHPVAGVGSGAVVLDNPTVGLATTWCRNNGFKAWLTEFGFCRDPWQPDSDPMHWNNSAASEVTHGITEGSALMNYMSTNSDVWEGWQFFSGGDFQTGTIADKSGLYAYNIDPPIDFNNGTGEYSTPVTDVPQMAVLTSNLVPSVTPTIVLTGANFTAGAAQGTAIGTLSTTGGVGTYTFTLTDSHSNATQVAGSHGVNLQVGSTVTSSPGTFNITVHADNGAGSTGDHTFTITVNAASSTLDDNFVTGSYTPGPVTSDLTCVRASSKSVTNSSGVVSYVSSNVLPITNAGMLLESGATNICLQSQALGTSPWLTNTTGSGTLSVTNNADTAPDGTTTATKIVFSRSSTGDQAQMDQQMTTANAPYALSVYVKAFSGGDVGKKIALGYFSGSNIGSTEFTLTNSWQRINIAPTCAGTSATFPIIGFIGGFGTQTGTVNVSVWGVQVEQASTPSSYIPTTTSTASRAADTIQIQYTGLKTLTVTYDDASTETIHPFANNKYTLPNNLNRSLITRIQGNGTTVPLRQTVSTTTIPDESHPEYQQAMSRYGVFARTRMDTAQIVIPNFNCSGGETVNGGTLTVTASIEYPQGNYNQLTFGGNVTGTTTGLTITSDEIQLNISIPNGQFLWVNIWASSTAHLSLNGNLDNNGNGTCQLGASGVPDKTMGGSVPSTATGLFLIPCIVAGRSTNRAVGIVGDSISYGAGDTFHSPSGTIAPSLRTLMPVANFGSPGDSVHNYLTNGSTVRTTLLNAYCTSFCTQYMQNDFGRTAAQIIADLQSLGALFTGTGPFYYGTGTPSGGSSTDNFNTPGGQTPAFYNSARTTVNTWVRGTSGFLELGVPLEFGLNSGIWRSPGDGTVTGITVVPSDGIHPTGYGYSLVVASGNINPAQFT